MAWDSNAVATHLVRSQVWTGELKEVFREEVLPSKGYVKWITDWPDVGGEINIPSLGEQTVQDMQEMVAPTYEAMDTGNFKFRISEYVGSATYITEIAKQNMFYLNELVSTFVPGQRRALEERLESDILSLAGDSTTHNLGGQVVSNANAINGIPHRWVAGGAGTTLNLVDFAKAKYALRKAQVPMSNLVAIVDPSTAFHLETLPNIVNMSSNPQWEGIVTTGLTTGMRFVRNIYGFDIYESNFNPVAAANETINGVNVGTNGIVNIFFSADAAAKPFIGKMVQEPTVFSEFNKDLQREEFLTVSRYGLGLYRPENLISILSDTEQVFG